MEKEAGARLFLYYFGLISFRLFFFSLAFCSSWIAHSPLSFSLVPENYTHASSSFPFLSSLLCSPLFNVQFVFLFLFLLFPLFLSCFLVNNPLYIHPSIFFVLSFYALHLTIISTSLTNSHSSYTSYPQ